MNSYVFDSYDLVMAHRLVLAAPNNDPDAYALTSAEVCVEVYRSLR
jgi:hypothetical protein